jgi:nucleoside-diphosphate-sugar epimerase
VARERLGWAPAIDYADGLHSTVEWFRMRADDLPVTAEGRRW